MISEGLLRIKTFFLKNTHKFLKQDLSFEGFKSQKEYPPPHMLRFSALMPSGIRRWYQIGMGSSSTQSCTSGVMGTAEFPCEKDHKTLKVTNHTKVLIDWELDGVAGQYRFCSPARVTYKPNAEWLHVYGQVDEIVFFR